MTYVKIFLNTAGCVEMLSDEERGRLFLAILRYAQAGELPDLTGNERLLWETFKWQIDRAHEVYRQKKKAGEAGSSRGGKKPPRERPPLAADYSALFQPLP